MADQELPIATPAIVSRKRRTIFLVGGIALLMLLLIVAAAGSIWLLRGSTTPFSENMAGTLPEALPATPSALVSPAPTISPTPALVSLAALPAAIRVPPFQNNLAVAITYQRSPQFSLTLGGLTRTIENPTPLDRQPAAQAPHSLLRVKDNQGAILLERRFAVITEVELVDGDWSSQLPPRHSLSESTTYIVVPVTSDVFPAQVELVRPDGQVLAERTFQFLELPVQVTTTAAIRLENSTGLKPSPVSSLLRSFIQQAFPVAAAQVPVVSVTPEPTPTPVPECVENCFVLAVVGASAEIVQAATQSARDMVTTLEPWRILAGHIKIVSVVVASEELLGCLTIEGANGKHYPLCPDESKIAQQLNGIKWNTAVVVTSADCDCGAVEDITMSTVAGVGKKISASIMGHELGHAVGRMADEYMYQYNIESGLLGPNCFASEASCQEDTAEVTGVQCAQGCRTVSSWRPSSKLMHTMPDDAYGPLETCIMAEQIIKVVGGIENPFGQCIAPDASPTPVLEPPLPGTYYGGRR